MSNTDNFNIFVASDVDYERLIIFFKYYTNTIALLDCEYGFEEAKIKFFNNKEIIWLFNCKELLNCLEIAHNKLIKLNCVKNDFFNECISKNFQIILGSFSDSKNPCIYLIHEGKNFCVLYKECEEPEKCHIVILNDKYKSIVWNFDYDKFIYNLKKAYRFLLSENTPLPPGCEE